MPIFSEEGPHFAEKGLGDSRWESRIEALKALRYQIDHACDALMEVDDDTSFTGSSGNETNNDAKNLANALLDLSFVVSLVLWYHILFAVNICSKLRDTDI